MRSGGRWNAGTYKCATDVRFNLVARSYLLHVPANAPEGKWPLVVVVHGAFNTARRMEEQTGFSSLADEKGFCVAYPNGIGIFGLLQHWNAGHCCGKAAKDDVNDVGYLDAVIEDVSACCPVDPGKVFIVGHSNGGMLVYRYVGERSERIAGAAVVAGAINSTADKQRRSWRPVRPKRPVPIMILHGTEDPAVPLEGGESPTKKDGRLYAPVSDAEDFWLSANGGAAPVRVELLEGWGHNWPGPLFTEEAGVPEALRGYDAAGVIWDFFQAISSD